MQENSVVANAPVLLTVQYTIPGTPELGEIAKALAAIDAEYRLLMSSHLRLHDARHRSPWTFDLVPLLMVAAGNAETINQTIATMKEFVGNMRGIKEWLMSVMAMPNNLAKVSDHLKNTEHIVAPASHDLGGNVNFTLSIGGDLSIQDSFNVRSAEVGSVRDGIERERARLALKPSFEHAGVSLRWYQARNDPARKTGSRAIIEALSPRHVKTTFGNETARLAMFAQATANPFRHTYTVDVTVLMGPDGPAEYVIQAVHDKQVDQD